MLKLLQTLLLGILAAPRCACMSSSLPLDMMNLYTCRSNISLKHLTKTIIHAKNCWGGGGGGGGGLQASQVALGAALEHTNYM